MYILIFNAPHEESLQFKPKKLVSSIIGHLSSLYDIINKWLIIKYHFRQVHLSGPQNHFLNSMKRLEFIGKYQPFKTHLNLYIMNKID
jgi:hypothetical protein